MNATSSKLPVARRGHRALWIALGTCAIALGGVGCGGGGASGGGSEGPDDAAGGGEGGLIGSKAPEIKAAPVMGDGPTSLAEASGKVVIIDFWATYCDPCKKSFPKYQELVDNFGGDLTVIAVSVDDPEDASQEKLEEFVSATGVKFPVVWDKEQETAKVYSPPKMPTSFVVDQKGVIRHMHAGYETGEEEEIEKEVKALLN
jgi:cytochrome c biogenesis protein CcmG/thiol:disulfide interchange protein DsbE